MKAIVVTSHGGPEVLEYKDVEPPTPSEGQLLVDVSYAGINYIDTYFRSGTYPSDPPYIPGTEGCGRVVSDPLGEIAPGTLVAWHEAPGSYAEQVAVDRNRLVAVPEGVAPEVAASMLLQGMTSHYLLHGVRETQPGDTMVVTAGAGGDYHRVAGLCLAHTVEQVVRGHALKQHGGRHLGCHTLRYCDEAVAIHRDLFSVGTGRFVPGHQGAGRDLAQWIAHHAAAPLGARDVRGI